jgi:hypothetical protein
MNLPIIHKALDDLVVNCFGTKAIDVFKRPASFIIKQKIEKDEKVNRIILLPPQGYTSNHLDELSSHEEACRAKIYIKGALRKNKKSFSLLKRCLKFSYLSKRKAVTESVVPYASVADNRNIYNEKIYSAKSNIYVVKENGEGFYHNLINITDEWLVLVLEKELRLMKRMDIQHKIMHLQANKRTVINNLINKIQLCGDAIFEKNTQLVKKAISMETHELLPSLIEALNMYETGRHEPCTVYAVILKKAKLDKLGVLEHIKSGINNIDAPLYYLRELEKKLLS